MKKAFTLAEIMIVLSVIGILTAILLPVAFQNVPNENVMKFKKANSTLGTVVRELLASDKYYTDGNLGIRADGNMVDGTHEGDFTYFCETFADVLNAKSVNCSTETADFHDSYYQINTTVLDMDKSCKKSKAKNEIITPDGISYFQTNPKMPFGMKWVDASPSLKEACNDPGYHAAYKPSCETTLMFAAKNSSVDVNGFGAVYKVFCFDVDESDGGEDPFGYGIRADGKIIPGNRAKEWLQKRIKDKE